VTGRKLAVEPLTRTAFAPFGDVIESEGRAHYPINAGTAERYHDLATVDVAASGGRPLISLCRAHPVGLPLTLRLMERHPLSSQAFIPLSGTPFLVVVAPAGELRLESLRAFRSNGRQGVNYHPGTWHHPLIALERVSDFLIVDRSGEGENCDEVPIAGRGIVIEG
jgi:ureidoglycolate lyase